MFSYLALAVLGALAYAILWREGLLQSNRRVFLSAGAIFLAMALRMLCMDHETTDYYDYQRWMGVLRENGGFLALGQQVGAYNYPYLYFLALFTYLPVRDIYLIKALSVLFDVLLAWGALRLARLVSGSERAGIAAFLLTLLLPTVILNGAYWGQCDSIFTAFGVWSVVYALENKPVRSVAAIALSFSFKPQAMFLMPVFLIFLYAKKINWYHLAVFPLTYAVSVLPAVAFGRPFLEALTVYLDQSYTVGTGLNYNSSSIYAFSPRDPADPDTLALYGYIAAFTFLLLLFALCSLYRERLNNRNLLICAVLISVAVPFFLPHMHDRYFFPADVLSLVLAVCVPALAPAAVGVTYASLLGYHAYLRMRYLHPMSYGAYALIAVIAVLSLMLVRELVGERKRPQSLPAVRGPQLAAGPAPAGIAAIPAQTPRKKSPRSRPDASLVSSRIQARKREREK